MQWSCLLFDTSKHSGLLWASLGVWSKPRHLIVTTTVVELYWDPPQQPHGHISQYKLKRDGRTVFTGDHGDQNYTDTGLRPHHRFVFVLFNEYMFNTFTHTNTHTNKHTHKVFFYRQQLSIYIFLSCLFSIINLFFIWI